MNEPLQRFDLGDVSLQSGDVLRDAHLTYKTYGSLNDAADNAIVVPTFYTGTSTRNEGYFGPGRAIDPARHFIVSLDMFGNGVASSPNNSAAPQDGPRCPSTTIRDNVACQHRLINQHLGVKHIRLVAGWSMGALQTYEWAAQFPDMVEAILPFCGSARCSPHNFVFLEGVKAALQADAAWNSGDYASPPERGLRAFGRVYAGWGFSQTFYREHHYRHFGHATIEDLLVDWEEDFLREWDANNLLHKLWTWQHADISSNDVYRGDFARALGAIRARAIVMPCTQDLYFPPEDSAIEVSHLSKAELRPFDSPFGHCAGSPGALPAFDRFFDEAVADLLNG